MALGVTTLTVRAETAEKVREYRDQNDLGNIDAAVADRFEEVDVEP